MSSTSTVTPINRAVEVSTLLSSGRYSSIARDTNYTRQHISGVLQGKRPCSFSCASSICDAVGITLDELRAYIDQFRSPRK